MSDSAIFPAQRRRVLQVILPALALLCAACALPQREAWDIADEPPPLKSVGYLDLERYMGRWYVIANIPYFAERGNVAPYVEYRLRPDGLIDDLYTARDGFDKKPFTKNGLIEITNPMTRAEGRITFLPPLWQDFAVLYVDEDYRHTVIGHPSRNYAWVFAREPEVPEAQYRSMLKALAANGFDLNRVMKIPQKPEQVGLPGFQ
jgi:apolipoprotein D and lipocalin family protein